MLLKYIVIVVLLLQIFCAAQARTPEDVINDFEEKFHEIHLKFSNFQEITSLTVSPLITNVTVTILNQNTVLNDILKHTTFILQERILEILHNTGMIDHKDLINHCIKEVNHTENTLVISALGGQKICVKTAKSFVNTISEYINTLNNELVGEHDILEVTKEECGAKSNPYDVQTCLINDLYIYYTSYVKEVEEEVEKRIEVVKNDISFVLKEFFQCDNFIHDGIIEDMQEILQQFRICVLEVVNSVI